MSGASNILKIFPWFQRRMVSNPFPKGSILLFSTVEYILNFQLNKFCKTAFVDYASKV